MNLAAEIARLAALIGATGYQVVGFDPHIDAGYPYVEVDGDQLHWIVKERGQVLDHRTTTDPDELLFWCFEATTFSMAVSWELHHRVEGQDTRIGVWAKQAELLHTLNPAWARRWRDALAARQPKDVALLPALPDAQTERPPPAQD